MATPSQLLAFTPPTTPYAEKIRLSLEAAMQSNPKLEQIPQGDAITPPSTPPIEPTAERHFGAGNSSIIELSADAPTLSSATADRIGEIKTPPIIAMSNALTSLRKALHSLPPLFTTDPSSPTSLSSGITSPEEIANYHSLIARSFSSFSYALGHATTALATCDSALSKLSELQSKTVTPLLTDHIAIKFRLIGDAATVDAELKTERDTEARILQSIKDSASGVEETQERLEEVRGRINALAEQVERVAERKREVETRRNRTIKSSCIDNNPQAIQKLSPNKQVSFFSLIISPVAFAAGVLSLNTRSADAEMKRLDEQAELFHSLTNELNPRALEKSLQGLLRDHSTQHEDLMEVESHICDLQLSREILDKKISEAEFRVSEARNEVRRVDEAITQMGEIRQKLAWIFEHASVAKCGLLNVLVNVCSQGTPMVGTTTVRDVVLGVLSRWEDEVDGEDDIVEELRALCEQEADIVDDEGIESGEEI